MANPLSFFFVFVSQFNLSCRCRQALSQKKELKGLVFFCVGFHPVLALLKVFPKKQDQI
jgi:hypothetical protein